MTDREGRTVDPLGGIREPSQKPLIPRKYRGFIPLGIVILVMAAFYLGPILFPEGSGGSSQNPSPTPTLTETATPTSSPASPTQPAGATTQGTVTATASPTYSGPPDFSLSTSPTSVSTGRGETVTYTMVIDGKNGFSAPVTLELTASALFVTRTYDFGTYDPPFPRTIQYPFTVPDYLPPGVTVDGTLRATGDGLVRENRLTLQVEF
jgi:hypothetical protein